MIDISWEQLKKNSESKEINFEHFCFQIAHRKYSTFGVFSDFYNTAGSEFYLELAKDCDELNAKVGDVIGWQAKFWLNKKDTDNSPLDVKHRNELIDGLKKTIVDKPNLKSWIICTPGKFSNSKPHYCWNALIAEIHTFKTNVEIIHWHKNIFESIYHDDQTSYHSIFEYYFNIKFIGKELLSRITNMNLKILEKKFDVDIHVSDKNESPLIASILLDKAKKELELRIKNIVDSKKKIEKNVKLEEVEFNCLSKEFVSLNQIYLKNYFDLIDSINLNFENSGDLFQTVSHIICLINLFQIDNSSTVNSLNQTYSEISILITRNEIDFKESNWLEFMLKCFNNLKTILLNKENENSLILLCERIVVKDLHVFGLAGYGKTNFACSIAYQLEFLNKPVLLLLGSIFKSHLTPKETILKQLEIKENFDFLSFLEAINNLGQIYKCKVPIIIDGLNESNPRASDVWNKEIYSLIHDINDFSNIILITTCREKSEYIQQIFDKNTYKDVENNIYIEGFTDKNKSYAINKYFKKYNITTSSTIYDKDIFKNPLRLKIFSTINEGKQNLDINLHSIVESIEAYINELSNRIATSDYNIDKIQLGKLRKGLKELGKLLWDNNSREILFFEDFVPIFNDDLTSKLIDEGLCFQRDLNNEDELVQFTYDLVGGFQIAKSTFFQNCSKDVIVNKLTEKETIDKLFCPNSLSRHPLHEDILKSISYLLPKKIGLQIYEIFNNESIIVDSLENLEILTSNPSDKNKFISYINNNQLNIDTKSKILLQLYDDIFQRNNFNTIDNGLNLFLSLSQYELDCIWNEIYRKDVNKLINRIDSIVNNIDDYEIYIENLMLFIVLLTGSSDKMLRSFATKSLMYIGLKHPFKLLSLSSKIFLINDIYVVESLICSLCGVVLRSYNECLTKEVVRFLENDFLVKCLTNHIAILDYIKTIFDYALSIYNIKGDKQILLRNKDEKWDINIDRLEEIKKHSFFGYDIIDYDFTKYQITTLSNESYDTKSKFTKKEIISLLLERIDIAGYNKNKYDEIEKQLNVDTKYKREIISEQVTEYSQKYLSIAYMELAGFLMINNQISPQFENTFRFDYLFFDPTFPKLPNKEQLINDCFLPFSEDIQSWILADTPNLLRNYYLTIPVFEKSQMVLLFGSINQKNEDDKTRISIFIDSYVFNKDEYEPILREFESDSYDNSTGLNQVFAGEISWREYSSIENYLFESEKCITSSGEYAWSSWTSDRYQNQHFRFLNPIIANEMNLIFDVNTLSYKNSKGKTVTKYYNTENSKFLYIDKCIFDEYIEINKFNLVWNKSISKYGDYGDFEGSKLNPSYKDLKKIDFYSELNEEL